MLGAVGSRDQNTITNGLFAALKRGSSTLVATAVNQSCCSTLATRTPGMIEVPGQLFSPRSGGVACRPAALIAALTSAGRGKSSGGKASSRTMVPLPSRAAADWMATGPSLPIAAVE